PGRQQGSWGQSLWTLEALTSNCVAVAPLGSRSCRSREVTNQTLPQQPEVDLAPGVSVGGRRDERLSGWLDQDPRGGPGGQGQAAQRVCPLVARHASGVGRRIGPQRTHGVEIPLLSQEIGDQVTTNEPVREPPCLPRDHNGGARGAWDSILPGIPV